ncbi:MAG: hypothetical protein GYB32_04730 [Algicola sp.]|nr:hypothetical protein [Algicola sp.]
MKLLYRINLIIFSLTITAYATIIFVILGMYMQILLGITQLIMAVILLFFMKAFTIKINKMLRVYWFAVVLTMSVISIMLSASIVKYEFLQLLFAFIIPMLIASYLLRITYLIQKQ